MQPFPSKSSRRKIGVYVHFPWCLEKCPYCDFLSVKVPGANAQVQRARELIPHQAYAEAVLNEAEERLTWLQPDDWAIDTVFFGGGTPSLWSPDALGTVLRGLEGLLPMTEDVEVTVECNPTSVDEAHFMKLREVGVGRVSIGVQATDNERLSFLGRLHDEAGGPRALREAAQAGIPRVSGDLIFGVHRQPPEAALSDVLRVEATGVSHLSCYALTIEENTRFGALRRSGRLPLLEEELVARSFEAISDELTSRGFEHYEISNYARRGERSRHNLGYWRGRDYLGLGTGAFGTVRRGAERLRYRNALSPERYMNSFQTQRTTAEDPFATKVSEREVLAAETSLAEAIMLGLRIAEGICPEDLENEWGVAFWTDERKRAARLLLDRGQLTQNDGRLRIPKNHWLLADGIIAALL